MDIWFGNGDGTFTLRPGAIVATDSNGNEDSYGAKPTVVADFNHDGKMDLAVFMNDLSGVEVLTGNGDGTFRPGFSLPVFGGGGIVAADLMATATLTLRADPPCF